MTNRQVYLRQWKRDNKDKVRTYSRTARARNPEKSREHGRKQYRRLKAEGFDFRAKAMWYKWRLTRLDYEALLKTQGGGCGICGQTPKIAVFLNVDHNHLTGNIRGLLCTSCNVLLGHAKDNLDILVSAIDYLKGHRTGSGVSPDNGEHLIKC